MFPFVKHLLSSQNQFASGGLLLMIIGSVGVFLRQLPVRVWGWIVQQTTMMITVKDDDVAFQWVKEWFLEQEFLKRVRRVDLDTTLRGQHMALIPAPGCHLFWYHGRPFWVWLYRTEETKGYSQRRLESLTFRTVGRQQAFLRQFVDEVAACHQKHARTTPHLYVWDDCWTYVSAYYPRLLESVILKPGEKEHLVQDMERFKGSRARYRQLGVPYHRGYLLYGPPGTGKTSLVSGLSARFGMSIYIMNLTEFTDRSLKSAMNDVPEDSMILFEDIDCMRTGNRRADAAAEQQKESAANGSEKNPSANSFGVTLSGLLNVLDGFHAPENVVFVMTTNRIEALDPALLRPGRIDYKLYMGEAAESQRMELYRRFFPEATVVDAREFVEAHHAETMAQFQGLLLGLEQEATPLLEEAERVAVLR
ncbi:MAG: AAA family ATPase [Acidobacteriota bacterium]|nr:AAA family ATPase [Acidobacteriota bacterium]